MQRYSSGLKAVWRLTKIMYVQTTTRNISTPQIHLQQPALTCSAFHVALTNTCSHTHTLMHRVWILKFNVSFTSWSSWNRVTAAPADMSQYAITLMMNPRPFSFFPTLHMLQPVSKSFLGTNKSVPAVFRKEEKWCCAMTFVQFGI